MKRYLRLVIIILLLTLATSSLPSTTPTYAKGNTRLSCEDYAFVMSGTYLGTQSTEASWRGPFKGGTYIFNFTLAPNPHNEGTLPTQAVLENPRTSVILAGPITVPGTLVFEMPNSPNKQPASLGFKFLNDTGQEIDLNIECARKNSGAAS